MLRSPSLLSHLSHKHDPLSPFHRPRPPLPPLPLPLPLPEGDPGTPLRAAPPLPRTPPRVDPLFEIYTPMPSSSDSTMINRARRLSRRMDSSSSSLLSTASLLLLLLLLLLRERESKRARERERERVACSFAPACYSVLRSGGEGWPACKDRGVRGVASV